jgi:hypothetical protein
MSACGRSYRLTTKTFAIIKLEGQNHPTTVPNGAVIKVLSGSLNGNRLVNVEWEDKTAMMFTTDIRERCVKLEEA